MNAAFFRKMNFNYSRSKIDVTGNLRPDSSRKAYDLYELIFVIIISSHDRINKINVEPSAITKDELITYYLTVLAFSFKNKL
jgi:hypothetical protein